MHLSGYSRRQMAFETGNTEAQINWILRKLFKIGIPKKASSRTKIDRVKLIELYRTGISHQEIADKLFCNKTSVNAVIQQLKRAGILKIRNINLIKSGETHSVSVLNEKQVVEILHARFIEQKSTSEIARLYNITASNVGKICSGKSWSKVHHTFIKKMLDDK